MGLRINLAPKNGLASANGSIAKLAPGSKCNEDVSVCTPQGVKSGPYSDIPPIQTPQQQSFAAASEVLKTIYGTPNARISMSNASEVMATTLRDALAFLDRITVDTYNYVLDSLACVVAANAWVGSYNLVPLRTVPTSQLHIIGSKIDVRFSSLTSQEVFHGTVNYVTAAAVYAYTFEAISLKYAEQVSIDAPICDDKRPDRVSIFLPASSLVYALNGTAAPNLQQRRCFTPYSCDLDIIDPNYIGAITLSITPSAAINSVFITPVLTFKSHVDYVKQTLQSGYTSDLVLNNYAYVPTVPNESRVASAEQQNVLRLLS